MTMAPRCVSGLESGLPLQPSDFMLKTPSVESTGWDSSYRFSRMKYDDVIWARGLQQRISSSLQRLPESLDSGPERYKQWVQQLDRDMSQLSCLFDSIYEQLPVTFRPQTQKPAAVHKVLDTYELLEQILGYLSPKDMLSAGQTNRIMASTVSSSKRLLQRLNVRPKGHFFYCPLEGRADWLQSSIHGPGIWIMPRSVGPGLFDTSSATDPSQCTFDLLIAMTCPERIRLGSRARSILVTDPALYSAEVYTNCCPHRKNSNAADHRFVFDKIPQMKQISNKAGLTCGDLHDAAVELSSLHRLCPRAGTSMLDPDGTVAVCVKFRGPVTVLVTDPAIEPRNIVGSAKSLLTKQLDIELAPKAINSEEKRLQRNRLFAYSRAKRHAYIRDQPTPTFAEFEHLLDSRAAFRSTFDAAKSSTPRRFGDKLDVEKLEDLYGKCYCSTVCGKSCASVEFDCFQCASRRHACCMCEPEPGLDEPFVFFCEHCRPEDHPFILRGNQADGPPNESEDGVWSFSNESDEFDATSLEDFLSGFGFP